MTRQVSSAMPSRKGEETYARNGDEIMKDGLRHIGIRIQDADLHYKLNYIARYEGRSANSQILFLIRKCIEEFESKHDRIQPPTHPPC
jgi:hypothetical protein